MKITSPVLSRRQSGFSLLELMLVVAIIAIIAVAALPQINEYNKRARSSRSSQNLKMLQSGFDQFSLDHGAPSDISTGYGKNSAEAAVAVEGVTSAKATTPLSRYVQVSESLFFSPNRGSAGVKAENTDYGYEVFSTADPYDPGILNLTCLVYSGYNTYNKFEPAANDSTMSTARLAAVNGYEDMGRLLGPGTNAAIAVYAGTATDAGSMGDPVGGPVSKAP